MRQLNIGYQSVDPPKRYRRDARIHNRKPIRQIAASIQEFGRTHPVVIDGSGGLQHLSLPKMTSDVPRPDWTG